jgi:hypothetical protein
LDDQVLSVIGSWASILAVSASIVIFAYKNTKRILSNNVEKFEQFKSSIAVLIDESTTANMRNDVAAYLNIWNRRWHSLMIRSYITFLGVLLIQLSIIGLVVFFVAGWEKYFMASICGLGILAQLWSTIAISRRAETHSEVFLYSWDKYIEANLKRSKK